jgi:hypothetical protein
MRPVDGLWDRLKGSPGEVAAQPQIPVLRPVEIAPPANLTNKIGADQRTDDQPVPVDQTLGHTLMGVTRNSGHTGLSEPVLTHIPHRRSPHIRGPRGHRVEVTGL